MKKIYLLLFALISLNQVNAQNQVPYGFNYQSIARDALGLPIVNTQVRLRISVIEANIAGVTVYQEEQTSTTNQFGLVTLVIGKGTYLGGTLTQFSNINWASNNYFVLVEVNNNNNWLSLGISQFQSVPYALASDNALKIQNQKISEIAPVTGQFLRFNAVTGQWEPSNLAGANGGTVTSVSGIAPIIVNGNGALDPQITIQQAGSGVDGYLSALDWALFNNKLDLNSIAGGDLSGTFNNLQVDKIQGRPIKNQLPTNGQVLLWNNLLGIWEPGNVGTGTVTTVTSTGPITITNGGITPQISISQANNTTDGFITATDYISFSDKLTSISGFGGDVSGIFNSLTVDKIKNTPIDLTGLASGQVLSFNGTSFVPAFISNSAVSLTSSTASVSVSGANIEIGTASGTSFGLLNPADFNAFNNKVSTIVGLNGITINQSGTAYSVVGQTFTQTQTTLTGINGATVTGNGFDYTIDGQNLQAGSGIQISGNQIVNTSPNIPTSIVGFNNITINQSGNAFSITGATFTSQATTFTGANGVTIGGSGFDVTIGGIAQNLSSSTASVSVNGLNFEIGTASGTSFGLLSFTDWATFNNKLSQPVSITGVSGATVSGSYPSFTLAGINNAWVQGGNSVSGIASFGTATNFDLPFVTNGNEAMRITNTGDILINTPTSIAGAKLEIYQPASTGRPSAAIFGGVGGSANLVFGRSTAEAGIGVAGASAFFSNLANPGDFIVRAAGANNNLILSAKSASGDIIFSTGIADSPKMILSNAGILSLTGNAFVNNLSINSLANGILSVDGTGKLVLGTTPSSQWLSTAGGVYYPTGVGIHALPTSSPLTIGTSSTIDLEFVPGAGGGTATIHASQPLILLSDVDAELVPTGNLLFKPGAVEAARFTPSGYLGLGVTTPNEKLTVQGNSSVTGTGYFGTIIGNNLTGAAGSIVTVDGFGKLGLGTLLYAVSQWVTTTTSINSGILYADTFVGIGSLPLPANDANLYIKDVNGNAALFLDGNSPALNFWSGANDAAIFTDGADNNKLKFATGFTIDNYSQRVASTRMTIDPTGNIGIGMSSPNQQLTVQGNSSITGTGYFGTIIGNNLTGAAGSIVTVDGFGKLGLGTPASISQWVNTINGIYYKNYVGIGSLNPQFQLHISSTSGASLRIDDNASNAIAIGSRGNVAFIESTGGLQIKSNSYSSVGSGLGGVPFIIDPSGNVGIGTINPNQQLTIQGNSSVAGIGYFGTIIGNNLTGAAGSIITVDGFGKLGIGSITSNNQWINSAADKIYTNSFVGIGSSNPTVQLTVQSNSSPDLAYFESFDAAGSTINIYNGGTDGARAKFVSDGTTFSLENKSSIVGFNFSGNGNDFIKYDAANSIIDINPNSGIVNIGTAGVPSNLSVTGNVFSNNATVNNLSGAGGSIVTVDGFGKLGIGTLPSVVSSQWISTVGGIYYTSLVGINGIAPLAGSAVSIKSTSTASKPLRIEASGNTFPIFEVAEGVGGFGSVQVYDNAGVVVNQIGASSPTFFNGGGYVGIGTNNPSEKLTVIGNSSVTGISYINGAINLGNFITMDGNSDIINANSGLVLRQANVGSPFQLDSYTDKLYGPAFIFNTNNSSATPTNRMVIYGNEDVARVAFLNASVGVGNTFSGVDFGVQGNSSVTGIGYFSTISGLALNGAASGSVVTINGAGTLGFGTLPTFTQQATSITGANYITVSGSGFALTIGGIAQNLSSSTSSVSVNGLNFEIGTASGTSFGLLNPVDFNAFNNKVSTIVGLNGITINQSGTSYSVVGQTFTQTQTTVTGINGATVTGSGFDYTINGQNLQAGSGIQISGNQIINTSPNIPLTLIGIGASTVTGSANNFTITTPNFTAQATSIIGTNNITVAGTGFDLTIGGIAQNLSSSTASVSVNGLNFEIGTASGTSFGLLNPADFNAFNNKVSTIIGLNGISINQVGSNYSITGNNLSQWTTSGANVYYDQGNVGIGTSSPFGQLGVVNTVANQNSGFFQTNNAASIAATIYAVNNGDAPAAQLIQSKVGGTASALTVISSGTGKVADFSGAGGVSISNNLTITGLSGAAGSVVTVDGNGTLGIGTLTNSSGQWITTTGGIYYGTSVGIGMAPDPSAVFSLKSSVGVDPFLIQRNGSSTYRMAAFSEESTGASIYLYDNASNSIPTWITSDNILPSYFTYSVGIGTTTPNELLTVKGNSSISGIGYIGTIIGNNLAGAAGSIVTVDGAGKLGVGSIAASQWQNNGQSIYYNTSFVGIGTATPSVNLEINDAASASVKIRGGSGAYLYFIDNGAPNIDYAFQTNGTDFVLSSSNDDYTVGTIPLYNFSQTDIHPFSDNTYGLGTLGKRWSYLYTNNASITGLAELNNTKIYGVLTISGLAGSNANLGINANGEVVTVSGGGSSQWTSASANQIYTNSFVGIGTSTPTSLFSLQDIYTSNGGHTSAKLDIVQDTHNGQNIGMQLNYSVVGYGGTMVFAGIETNVKGSPNGTPFVTTPAYSANINVTGNGNVVGFQSAIGGSNVGNKIGFDANVNGVGGANNIGINVTVSGGTNNYAALLNGGNVGIGTTSPNQPLAVVGNSSVTGTGYFSTISGLVLNGAAAGSVVTVDGNGTLGFGSIASGGLSGVGQTNGIAYYNSSNTLTSTSAMVWDGTALTINGVKFTTTTTGGNTSFYVGQDAGTSNTTGTNNNFIGFQSGYSNTSGFENNFMGDAAGYANISGNNNNFMGYNAGYHNISGASNNYIGNQAGLFGTGSFNNFFGYQAGVYNTGSYSLLLGYLAGSRTNTGSRNIAIGYQADFTSSNVDDAIVIGSNASVSGSNMMAIGADAGTTNALIAVGISTSSPTAMLDVNGNARIRNLSIAGTVISDALGNLSVSTVTSGTNYFTISGNNIEPISTNDINITATGAYKIGGNDVIRKYGNNNSIMVGGAGSAASIGDYNVFIGAATGSSNTSGYFNTFIGRAAGTLNTTGTQNNFIGNGAGYNSSGATFNNLLGYQAGYSISNGDNNNMIGSNAGFANTNGSNNNFIGSQAGANSTGSNNIAIGTNTDMIPGISNAIVIGNNITASGDNMIVMGGSNITGLGINTNAPTAMLDVNGSTRIRNLSIAGTVISDALGNLSVTTLTNSQWTTTTNGIYSTSIVGIGVNTFTGNEALRISSYGGTKGMVLPYVTTAQMVAMSVAGLGIADQGMILWDLDDKDIAVWDGTKFQNKNNNSGGNNVINDTWSIVGQNSIGGSNMSATGFGAIGTADAYGLRIRTNNLDRMVVSSTGGVTINNTSAPTEPALQVNADIALGTTSVVSDGAVVIWLQNSIGTPANKGDIVVVGGGNNTFAYTSSATTGDNSVIGVLYEPCGVASVCRVAISGVVFVNTSAAVTRGQHVVCESNVNAGKAVSTALPNVGSSVGVFLETKAAPGSARVVLR